VQTDTVCYIIVFLKHREVCFCFALQCFPSNHIDFFERKILACLLNAFCEVVLAMQQDQTLNVREAAFLLLLPMCSLLEMTSSKYVEGHISTAEVSFNPCSVHFFHDQVSYMLGSFPKVLSCKKQH